MHLKYQSRHFKMLLGCTAYFIVHTYHIRGEISEAEVKGGLMVMERNKDEDPLQSSSTSLM